MGRQVVVYGPARPAPTRSRGRTRPSGPDGQVARGYGATCMGASNNLDAVEIDAIPSPTKTAGPFHALGIKVETKNLGVWDTSLLDRAIAAGADWIQTDLLEDVLAHALWLRVKNGPCISRFTVAPTDTPLRNLPASRKPYAWR